MIGGQSYFPLRFPRGDSDAMGESLHLRLFVLIMDGMRFRDNKGAARYQWSIGQPVSFGELPMVLMMRFCVASILIPLGRWKPAIESHFQFLSEIGGIISSL